MLSVNSGKTKAEVMLFNKLTFDKHKVYPALVVSTVSSGKSTLINALVGAEYLPSSGIACTARAIAILDNDRKAEFEAHIVNTEGKYNIIRSVNQKVIERYNSKIDISEMILEGQIKGIKNNKKSLLLIDTPGVNNCMDLTHAAVTKTVLDTFSEGLILYVMNAQQLCTYDDSNFLDMISLKLKEKSKFKIIFVINRMDLIDKEKEAPAELIQNCKRYIEAKGIEDPILIPVSAASALAFKKVLQNEELTELEMDDFFRYYKKFRNQSFSLLDYQYVPEKGNLNDVLNVDGNKYSKAEIYGALYNTGIPYLESIIDDTLVWALKMRAPRITCKNTDEGSRMKKKSGGIFKSKLRGIKKEK